MAEEKRYYVTSNVTFKLSAGQPVVIVDNKVLSPAQPPVVVTLPRLHGGSEGFTVSRVRQLAEMNNNKDAVARVTDTQISKALDELEKRSPSVWGRTEYIARTRGKVAAAEDKQIQTLSAENATLKAELAKMQERLGQKK